MKTKAAVVYEFGKPIEIEELDLDGPKAGEVLIRYTYAGLCHSDVHVAHGDLEARLPMVLGHEGAGIIEEVGPGVTRVAVGDHVVCSFIPNLRVLPLLRHRHASRSATWVRRSSRGYLPGPRVPTHRTPRGDYGAVCMLGTFSQYGVINQTSCVKVDDDLPLDKAVLVGCGVPTGLGFSRQHRRHLKAGDTAVIFGVGGIGINAVQGARHAGAKNVIAIDPLENKREKALWSSARHTRSRPPTRRWRSITELTRGQMADAAILTPGLVTSEIVTQGFHSVGKGGVIVVTGLNKLMEQTIELPGTRSSPSAARR